MHSKARWIIRRGHAPDDLPAYGPPVVSAQLAPGMLQVVPSSITGFTLLQFARTGFWIANRT
jgi:hypothetical protein